MLENPNTVDIVLKKDKMGRVGLVITAHEAWDSRTVEQLRAKLAHYAFYIKSPQYRSQNGSAPAFIRLASLHEPTAEVHSLLAATGQASDIVIETEVFAPPGFSPRK